MVLIDNGRSAMREDPVLHEALYCIRCSACLNVCANFETVGGHAFGGETYSGGIGGSWEAGTGKLMNARFSELCTGCSRCVPQLPGTHRHSLAQPEPAPAHERGGGQFRPEVALWKPYGQRAGRQGRFAAKAVLRQLSHPRQMGHEVCIGGQWIHPAADGARRSWRVSLVWTTAASCPRFRPKTWEQLFREEEQRGVKAGTIEPGVVMLADTFTNYGSPERGMAAVRVLRAIGVDVVLSPSIPDGRAAMSQGMIDTARSQARAMADMLRPYLDSGRKIVVIEPSVLAMLHFDVRHLLDDEATDRGPRGEQSSSRCRRCGTLPVKPVSILRNCFPAAKSRFGTRLFYHSHCQQRTCNAASQTVDVLRAAGFDVVTSSVECCGMAGSFGYKHDYYELSMAVGADLFAQVRQAELRRRTAGAGGQRYLLSRAAAWLEWAVP